MEAGIHAGKPNRIRRVVEAALDLLQQADRGEQRGRFTSEYSVHSNLDW